MATLETTTTIKAYFNQLVHLGLGAVPLAGTLAVIAGSTGAGFGLALAAVTYGLSRLMDHFNYSMAKPAFAKQPSSVEQQGIQGMTDTLADRLGVSHAVYANIDLAISPEANLPYNAYAYKNTITAGKTWLPTLPPGQKTFLFYHELAHIKYKDSALHKALDTVSTLAMISMPVAAYMVLDQAAHGIFAHDKIICSIIPGLAAGALTCLYGAAVKASAQRSAEYAADGLAYLKSGNCAFLEGLKEHAAEYAQPESWLEKILATHPPVEKRCEHIARLPNPNKPDIVPPVTTRSIFIPRY